MGFFSKKISKKASEAKAAAARLEKKDLVEACVAAAVLVSFADGELEESEITTLQAVIQANDTFQHFQNDVPVIIDKYVGLMKAGKTIGKMKLLREIEDVKASQDEKEEVFATAVSLAEADGEIEATEVTILKEIGRKLGIGNVDSLLSA